MIIIAHFSFTNSLGSKASFYLVAKNRQKDVKMSHFKEGCALRKGFRQSSKHFSLRKPLQ